LSNAQHARSPICSLLTRHQVKKHASPALQATQLTRTENVDVVKASTTRIGSHAEAAHLMIKTSLKTVFHARMKRLSICTRTRFRLIKKESRQQLSHILCTNVPGFFLKTVKASSIIPQNATDASPAIS